MSLIATYHGLPNTEGDPWRVSDGDARTPTDSSRYGWDEGRTEPARFIRRPDAAERGHAPAHTGSGGREGRSGSQGPEPDAGGCIRASEAGGTSGTTRRVYEPPADTDGDGREGIGRQLASERDPHRRSSADTAWGIYEPAIRRWERLTRPAPPPTETGPKGGQRLSPRFTEWMQGWPDGWVTDVPGITRNDALRICGNGVVPQQAAEAYRRILAALALNACEVAS